MNLLPTSVNGQSCHEDKKKRPVGKAPARGSHWRPESWTAVSSRANFTGEETEPRGEALSQAEIWGFRCTVDP